MPAIVYDLAIVEDRGSYYQVLGLTKNTFDVVANGEEKHLKLSSIAADIIRDELSKGNSVRLPKVLQFGEVLPGELQIIKAQDDPLQAHKNAAIYKLKQLVTFELGKISSFDLYRYNVLHDELAAEGYFITSKNREQKYIEIIESGDINLISSLEKYLESRDTLDRAVSAHERLDSIIKTVQSQSQTSEVDRLLNEFLTTFYANE